MTDQNTLPIEIMVGDRTYELLPVLEDAQWGETEASTSTLVARARKWAAHDENLKDYNYLLSNQGDIPETIRRKVRFVFPALQSLAMGEVSAIGWSDEKREWIGFHAWYKETWKHFDRLLRRKS